MLHADLNNNFGYFDKAIKDYSKAILANNQMAQAYYNRGAVYFKMADVDKAYADFNKAIRLDSSYILALGGRAAIRIYKKENQRMVIPHHVGEVLHPKIVKELFELFK
jgi:tetratricopeptide (TPR) repeat protein